jgi:hypothetical protein
MCGCWSLAASWISRSKRLDVDARAGFRWKDLDDYLASEPRFLGEKYVAHPTAPELSQDVVGVTDDGLEARLELDAVLL